VINISNQIKEAAMTTYSLLKELSDIQDLTALEEGVDTSALKNSGEFKGIQSKDQKMAKALELQWGAPEFYMYVNKVLDGIKKGDAAYKHVTPDVKLDLSRLVRLHSQKFPKVEAPKPAKAGAYKWDDENTDIRSAKRMEALENLKAGLTESEFAEFKENLETLILID
jgi:hypothetical protein